MTWFLKHLASGVAMGAIAACTASAPAGFPGYAEGESEETNWHLSLLGELDAAMAAGQVWNAYQPKLDIASGRIVGVEALVRWDHPERGPIRPDQFTRAKVDPDAMTFSELQAAIGDLRDAGRPTAELGAPDDGATQKFAEALLIPSVLLDGAMDLTAGGFVAARR